MYGKLLKEGRPWLFPSVSQNFFRDTWEFLSSVKGLRPGALPVLMSSTPGKERSWNNEDRDTNDTKTEDSPHIILKETIHENSKNDKKYVGLQKG